MKNLHSAQDRAEIVQRIGTLTPKHTALWGTMTVSQMIVHLADSARMATGELPMKIRETAFRFPPLKQLIIYVLPFPKNVPTVPELKARKPSNWRADMADLQYQLVDFGKHANRSEWPKHPAFGRMSAKDWGVLGWKHFDYHLRQFGA